MHCFISGFYCISQRRQWHPTPVLLPGKSHGRRSLVGCSPWGLEESDTTERLHFHFSLSCIGEGNGNPLQCSCLENPRDRGAWWASVYGVSQSQTQLKRLSSRAALHFSGIFWFLCQSHIVLITIDLVYTLKFGNMPPVLFFLKIALAIQSSVIPYEFRIVCSIL